MKKWSFVALLLVGATVLGATVLREPIAWAAQAVDARIIGPVDERGNVAVHEQGTANVNVTNSNLAIAPAAPVIGGGGARSFPSLPVGAESPCLGGPCVATALSIHLTFEVERLLLRYQGSNAAEFLGPTTGGNSIIALALSRPVKFDNLVCIGALGGTCSVGWIGAEP